MDMAIDPKQLEALDAVARTGTFLKASQSLHISQPAVSERIRLLEEHLGQPLLVRTTPVRLTQLGQKLISHHQQIMILEKRLLSDASGEAEDWMRVPVAVNYDSLSSWFISAVSEEILARKIKIEIHATNESQTLDYLRKGEALACVSSDPKAITGCRSNYLGTLSYRCVASPKLLKRRQLDAGKLSGEALLELPAITYGKDDHFHETFLREHYGLSDASPLCLYVPFLEAMKEALLAGWGYGLALEIEVADAIEKGRLVDLSKGKNFEVHLYWHSVELSNSALSAFSEAIFKYAKKRLKQR